MNKLTTFIKSRDPRLIMAISAFILVILILIGYGIYNFGRNYNQPSSTAQKPTPTTTAVTKKSNNTITIIPENPTPSSVTPTPSPSQTNNPQNKQPIANSNKSLTIRPVTSTIFNVTAQASSWAQAAAGDSSVSVTTSSSQSN